MKKIYYSLKLKLSYLVKGIKTRKEIHLMDIVVYKDEEWFVNNAIRSCGQCRERIYDLVKNIPFDKNGKRESAKATTSEIIKVKNWFNFKRGILNVYEFNMTYWHDTNLEKLIK